MKKSKTETGRSVSVSFKASPEMKQGIETAAKTNETNEASIVRRAVSLFLSNSLSIARNVDMVASK